LLWRKIPSAVTRPENLSQNDDGFGRKPVVTKSVEDLLARQIAGQVYTGGF
jgi:hypothetical protein